MECTTIPEWITEGATPSLEFFFQAIELAGLTGKSIRLTADTQRALIGHNVFGHASLTVNDDHTVKGVIKVCFGNDFSDEVFTYSRIKNAVQMKKKLRPGYTGVKYA